MPDAYPLHWPEGRPRTPGLRREDARFRSEDDRGMQRRVTMPEARRRLRYQLDLLSAQHVVLSTNVPLRNDGEPRARYTIEDPGAAVYYTWRGEQYALCCDAWTRVEDNIVAIAKHIEALRGIERWGVGTIEQAFRGFKALPGPEEASQVRSQRPWWEVLEVSPEASPDVVRAAYRAKAHHAHPDHGGDPDTWAELQAAWQAFRQAGGRTSA